MANKKPHPLDDPSTASSSEDDELKTSEEEGSSSEEDEPQTQAPIETSSTAVKVVIPGEPTVDVAEQQDESESKTGSESETDSDSKTERPNPPNSGSGKAVTVVSPKPKQKEATLALPAVKSGTKRASEGTSRDTKKRTKTVTSGDDDKKTGEVTKKPPFTRLWSEEDKLAVLQGMIDFKANTGKSPFEDTNVYYEFIRNSISFEVSKNQCMDKIRSLKKKYMGKEMKGAKSSCTKPHDQKCFELSKTIWGPEGIALETAVKSKSVSKKKKKKKKKKKLDTVRQELVFNGKNVEEEDSSISGFGIDEHSVEQRWRLVPEETKKRFEDRFKALQAEEIAFVLLKTEFLHQVTSIIAEASKNSGN